MLVASFRILPLHHLTIPCCIAYTLFYPHLLISCKFWDIPSTMLFASFRILPLRHLTIPCCIAYTLFAPVTFSLLRFYRKELKQMCLANLRCDSATAQTPTTRIEGLSHMHESPITERHHTFFPGCFPSSLFQTKRNLCVNKPALIGTKLRPVECHANASGWSDYWILAWNILIHIQPPDNQCHGPAETLTHLCADILKIHSSSQQKFSAFSFSNKLQHFVCHLFERLVLTERPVFFGFYVNIRRSFSSHIGCL
jgi:hypothetical protein